MRTTDPTRRAQIALTAATLALIAGCTSATNGASSATAPTRSESESTSVRPSTSTTTPPPATASTPPSTAAGPAPLAGAHEGDPDVTVTLEPAEAALATDSAVAFLRAFARPDLPYEQWWAGVQSMLTPAGAEAYSYVDPANVPVTQVDPAAQLRPNSTPVLAVVVVSTDAGDYEVTMQRAGQRSWLVDRATPIQ